MKYILTAGWDDGVADLTDRLVRELADGKRVLWLLSGGSNVPASVQVMANVPDELSRQLTVSLIDERYGEPGHKDSNWQQLMESGFDGKRAKLEPVLQAGQSFEATAKSYEKTIGKALASNDIVIAQLGVGPDGHIAGILPDSPAAKETSSSVKAYEAGPLQRLTLTFPALRRIDVAFAFAFGKPKRQALEALKTGSRNPTEQPSRILYELAEAYVYNDQVGDHA